MTIPIKGSPKDIQAKAKYQKVIEAIDKPKKPKKFRGLEKT